VGDRPERVKSGVGTIDHRNRQTKKRKVGSTSCGKAKKHTDETKIEPRWGLSEEVNGEDSADREYLRMYGNAQDFPEGSLLGEHCVQLRARRKERTGSGREKEVTKRKIEKRSGGSCGKKYILWGDAP